ncbi:MAG: Integrase [Hyphomicrobiales bacterium]|nr:Integrase [Hyphomicrobiales bacterium]
MPRPKKPARLYARRRAGRETVWVILDNGHEQVVAHGEDGGREAEEKLAEYIGQKREPIRRGDPSVVPVSDILTVYVEQHAPKTSRPELTGYTVAPLLTFWGTKNVDDIHASTCRAYTAWRTAQPDPRYTKDPESAPRISESTARRELATLSAAIGFAFKERVITRIVPVTLPDASEGRVRWLTRSEAARLLAGALGFWHDGTRWRRNHDKISRHVARFILIGLYTGTRHGAILKLRWMPHVDGGWIDIENGLIYRRGYGERQTNKRRTPLPIPRSLAPHVRGWRRNSAEHVVEFRGKPILKERKAWASARKLAGLAEDVTPHVLKHTCATWLLQKGRPLWEVAGYLGTSEQVISEVYGHHSSDFLKGSANAL